MDNHEIARLLGQATRVIQKIAQRELPKTVLDALLTTPSIGMGMLPQYTANLPAGAQTLLARILSQLPAELPKGPVSIVDQGGFWLGYYQRLPQAEPEDVKPSSIYFELPSERKSAYVQAARQSGQKLIPWVMAQLDKAVHDANNHARP